LAVEIEENQIRCGFLIVTDQITHEDIEDIIVDRNADFGSRHDVDLTAIPIKGQRFLTPEQA
jgi:hypothetical protein